MNQEKAQKFWQTVVDNSDALCALLDASTTGPGFQEDAKHISEITEVLRNAACDIDPLLSVEIEQVPNNDGAVLRVTISCDHNPEGIEAVQELVALAPPMPPRLHACAFTPPLPKETARELDSLQFLGREVPLQKVRFLAEPNSTAPGTFDIVCFVPPSGITGMDPEEVPGAVVANVVLSMGIGELRVMTRVRSIGIAVTEKPPAHAVAAWDLLEIIDHAPTH